MEFTCGLGDPFFDLCSSFSEGLLLTEDDQFPVMIDHARDDAAYLSRKLADRFPVSSSSSRSPLRLVSQLALKFVLVCQRILSGRLEAPLLAESPYDILCIGPLPCRQLPMRIEEEDRSDGTSFQETGKGGLDLLLDLHRQHVWNGLHRGRLL